FADPHDLDRRLSLGQRRLAGVGAGAGGDVGVIGAGRGNAAQTVIHLERHAEWNRVALTEVDEDVVVARNPDDSRVGLADNGFTGIGGVRNLDGLHLELLFELGDVRI